MVFLVLFCSRRATYIVQDDAKKITSVGLSAKGVIFSKNSLLVRCSLRKIKWHYMLIFWSESRGNTVDKAKVSV